MFTAAALRERGTYMFTVSALKQRDEPFMFTVPA